MLGEDNNGSPALSARIAARAPSLGEVGLSYYGGFYNSFRVEGENIDDRRWLAIAALDFGGRMGPAGIRGEIAYVSVDVPPGMAEVFGDAQWGDTSTPWFRSGTPAFSDTKTRWSPRG